MSKKETITLKKWALIVVAAVLYVGVMNVVTYVRGVSGTPVPVAAFKAETLTNSDIIKMSNAHLSEATIIMAIDSAHGGFAFDVRPDALVTLKNAGVSDKMIETVMQRNLTSKASESSKGKADDEMNSGRQIGSVVLLTLFILITIVSVYGAYRIVLRARTGGTNDRATGSAIRSLP
jgi:hypothetical protein